MAIARAEKVLTSNPRAEEVSLEGFGLESLSPLLHLFHQMTRLKKLKLTKNNLTGLPEDLTALGNLEFLDLSGNPISGLSSVLRGLFCLTRLKHLYVDLPFETDEDEVIVSLHSLESFNGTPLTETLEDEEAPTAPAAQASSQNNRTPSAVPPQQGGGPRQAWGPTGTSPAPGAPGGASRGGNPTPRGGGASATIAATPALGAKTRWEESDMSQVQRLYQAANSVSGRVVHKAEFDEYSRNVVSHLQTLIKAEEDPFKREAEILKAKKILFEYCFEEIARSSHKFDSNLSQVLSVLQESYASLLESFEKLVSNVTGDKDRKLSLMKDDMSRAIQEIESLMHQMDTKGTDAANKAQWDAERRKMTEEMGWLRTENEKLQARLRQSELARAATPGGATSTGRGLNAQGGGSQSPGRQAPPAIGTKVLTLQQLRNTIEDIYTSKSRYDQKCADSHLPRETMEQHMYTYLNQKYGLKHLILEWATAIVQGIKRYSAEDNGVAVFGKILRNEIDEEFRFVQRQLKETVAELLRVYLKGKFPLKSDEDINQMMRKKCNGTVSEDEWVDIVKYLYNTEDSVSIIMRIKDILKQRAAPRRRAAARRRGDGSGDAGAGNKGDEPQLTYNEFIRILLDFQLEGHERFLARFVRIFKQYDTDRNGIVNEHEFRQVLRAVDSNKSEDEVASLLDLIDPYNNQLITFSECVTFLSSELVRLVRDDAA